MLAKQGIWDKNVANLKDTDSINVDFSLFSYFLSGKNNRYINIKNQALFDIESDSFAPEDPRVMLHLANGGLSQLAKHISMQLSGEEVGLSFSEARINIKTKKSII